MSKKSELNVALVQAPLVWENPSANRDYFSKRIEEIKPGTDLIILPEMFTTGFTMTPKNVANSQGNETIAWMKEQASVKQAAILGSIAFYKSGNYYNKMCFVAPNGKIVDYDKRHTFTFAGEDKIYKAGKMKVIVNYGGFKICPLICYDLRFPVWSRNTENYDVLVYVANWPKPRVNAWDALLKARAIENMAYCIGVNRIGSDNNGHEYLGHSAIYDSLGERMVFSEKEEVLYGTLQKEHINTVRENLKFLEDRDSFTVIP